MTGDTLARRWQSHNRWNIYPTVWVMLPVTSCDEMWSVERASENVDVCFSGQQSKSTWWRLQAHDMAKAQYISGKQMTRVFKCFSYFHFWKRTINRNPGVLVLGHHMTVSDSWHQISLFFFWVSFQLPFSPFLCLPHTQKHIFGYDNHFHFCGTLLTTLTPTPSSFLALYPPLMLVF